MVFQFSDSDEQVTQNDCIDFEHHKRKGFLRYTYNHLFAEQIEGRLECLSLDPRHVLNFLSRGTQKDLDIIGDKYAINVKNESLALRFIKKHQEERGGSNAASDKRCGMSS